MPRKLRQYSPQLLAIRAADLIRSARGGQTATYYAGLCMTHFEVSRATAFRLVRVVRNASAIVARPSPARPDAQLGLWPDSEAR